MFAITLGEGFGFGEKSKYELNRMRGYRELWLSVYGKTTRMMIESRYSSSKLENLAPARLAVTLCGSEGYLGSSLHSE